MTKVLFICHGNICRSTMAQYVFLDLVRRAGRESEFEIDSAATSREEIGNGVDPRTRRRLTQEGIWCGHHRARQVTRADYDRWDWLIAMDAENLWGLRRIIPEDPQGKVRLLLDWTEEPRDIADPWYTGNFDAAYRDIRKGCETLLSALTGEVL
ncbi:MAG: low molecular weight phosphotyrosine protein phosphatase [Clostridia bacterium]|nr:low molecular weight phosphotyrosine protein phosphatase [Clostridia bacterium]